MEKEFRWGQVQRGDLEVVSSVANSKTFPLSIFFPSPKSILLCKSLKGFLPKDPSHLPWKGVTILVNFFQLGVYKLETAWILQAKWPAWGKCPGNNCWLTGFDQDLGLGLASQYSISCVWTIKRIVLIDIRPAVVAITFLTNFRFKSFCWQGRSLSVIAIDFEGCRSSCTTGPKRRH